MLGAIIGDVASSTWRGDKKLFYQELIEENAHLSQYGMLAYEMALLMANNRQFTKETLVNNCCQSKYAEGKYTKQTVLSRVFHQSYIEQSSFAIIAMGLSGWLTDDIDRADAVARQYASIFMLDKEEFYALNILPKLVVGLRNGLTKDEALLRLDEPFRNILSYWDKQRRGSLGILARAWDAFYYWYDFTSVIHSAVKSPVQPQMTSIVAGMLAEAMYGYGHGIIKRKYSNNNEIYIPIGKALNRISLINDWCDIGKFDMHHALFYHKNDAATNVERHKWRIVANPFGSYTFNQEDYNKIKRAFVPDWDHRNGIYLDNGWFYIYRNGYLLSRFKIKELSHKYVIDQLQMIDDIPYFPTNYEGVKEAILSALYLSGKQ